MYEVVHCSCTRSYILWVQTRPEQTIVLPVQRYHLLYYTGGLVDWWWWNVPTLTPILIIRPDSMASPHCSPSHLVSSQPRQLGIIQPQLYSGSSLGLAGGCWILSRRSQEPGWLVAGLHYIYCLEGNERY